jgi:predicted DNA-binding protein
MSQGITTSIRLNPELNTELEKAARNLHRGKNWIISQALKAYLEKINQHSLIKEAQRQSLLAKKMDRQVSSEWEDETDTSGWE